MAQSIENKILARIYGNGRGWTFSNVDFIDLAKSETIRWVLYWNTQKGTIRRVIQGLYDYPRFSELLQRTMPPDMHQVARALARKFNWRIQPGGAVALNLMDISTQVPSRFVFLSDGPNRTYRIGETVLTFKHQVLKEAGLRHYESTVLVQGLKELGQYQITDEVIHQMRVWLPAGKRMAVLRDAKGVTTWVYEAIRRICQESSDG